MDKCEYSNFILQVSKYLKSKRLNLDPQDVAHNIIEIFHFTKIPPFLNRRIIDVLRQEFGHNFQRYELFNPWQLKPNRSDRSNKIKEFEMRKDLETLMQDLNFREVEILNFHLDGFTDSEIGGFYNLSQARISQIIESIITRFQTKLGLPQKKVRRAQSPRKLKI